MTLNLLRQRFHDALDALYGKEEVQSFFFMLLEHFLGVNRMTFHLDPNKEINTNDEIKFLDALEQLKQQKPIQYIIGETEFFGLPFRVNQNVLIPRPETEELVSWIIDSYSEKATSSLQILDIGTGSGCIAIALANHFRYSAQVTAMDVSSEALSVAKQNAELNQVKIQFLHQDILKFDMSSELNQSFDIIVSNPPYVRQLEKTMMQPNVLDHEPDLALFVEDHNPLLLYDAICTFSRKNLKPNGTLFFEINEYLGQDMMQLLKSYGFKNVELKKDLFGKDRMLKGTL
ncbi:peptide chain release factor N(5)-glutamine methyltransferase [Psychroserpens sp. XS_ASV72]|uniref:peptide chain release factor N(5)-glutamine methyltransferase n=1 Tax=Psychroserpens sp. XS_ASV72 TaxID=3241293 RepID=UPI003513696E